jgi:hypothetical protein
MTGLRVLHLTTYIYYLDDWMCIPTILNNITSHAISHVRFTFKSYAGGPPMEAIWTGIPSIIARPNFRHLGRLEFLFKTSFCSDVVVDEMKGWVSRQLQSLKNRDILHVDVQKGWPHEFGRVDLMVV